MGRDICNKTGTSNVVISISDVASQNSLSWSARWTPINGCSETRCNFNAAWVLRKRLFTWKKSVIEEVVCGSGLFMRVVGPRADVEYFAGMVDNVHKTRVGQLIKDWPYISKSITATGLEAFSMSKDRRRGVHATWINVEVYPEIFHPSKILWPPLRRPLMPKER